LDYNQVLMANPGDAVAYYNRANCRAGLDDHGAGISDLDEAIKLEPKNASYYKQRGNFYYQIQQRDKACFDWRKAVELGDAKARFQLDQYCKKYASMDSPELSHRILHALVGPRSHFFQGAISSHLCDVDWQLSRAKPGNMPGDSKEHHLD